jgi:hypothetical protein
MMLSGRRILLSGSYSQAAFILHRIRQSELRILSVCGGSEKRQHVKILPEPSDTYRILYPMPTPEIKEVFDGL